MYFATKFVFLICAGFNTTFMDEPCTVSTLKSWNLYISLAGGLHLQIEYILLHINYC
jgi:hypothetical protein